MNKVVLTYKDDNDRPSDQPWRTTPRSPDEAKKLQGVLEKMGCHSFKIVPACSDDLKIKLDKTE